MKNLLSRPGPLSLFLSVTALAAASVALAQLSDVPPVKMGLWQSQVTSTMTGLENTPMAAMGNSRTMVSQSCLTPEGWKKDIQGVNQRRGCTMTNLHQDSHEVSFDEACTSGAGGANTTHLDFLIDSSDHVHGTATSKIADPRLPNGITVNMTMETHFVSSDCGDVKPGQGKIVH